MERRVLDLRAVAAEQLEGPIEESVAWLICDRCRLRVRVSSDLDRPLMDTSGWGLGPEGDLCPTCARGSR